MEMLLLSKQKWEHQLPSQLIIKYCYYTKSQLENEMNWKVVRKESREEPAYKWYLPHFSVIKFGQETT